MPARGRPRSATVLAYIASIAAWLIAAGVPSDGSARWIGALAFHLVAAALIRWLWIRPQRPKPEFWGPSVFLIAAGVALLGRMGQSPT